MMWLAVLILLSTTNIIDCKAQHPLFESFEVPVFNPKPSSGSLVKPNAVARFSILTERLIRLEFDESGIFRNFPSFAVVNRYIKPPPFLIEYPGNGRMLVKTKYLTLSYAYQHNNSFTDDSLSIEFLHSNGTTSTWKPSMDPAEGNLRGTVRNLDNYYKAPDLDCRFETDPNQHCTLGLISRTGWTLIDDTFTPRLDHQTPSTQHSISPGS
ncbi:hypothetical protein BCR33DRAFT_781261 [Rhizoclosmatium globosum]|uniref:Galactose mutarotase N-terminal barrel domain-containing protein n=1 Tax=Rhizoclosmatium globosum TaxID=329046 RepID=A0A1Y2CU27_9FUNG|nr:hypothetical protein BCR33DRAFT_781261 [Rhizoclosmatium globosum]|eukprot:ORY50560.1 hypothetical protein BCR33DRAFT_781261 [Rhizoclosmatium globosum]